MTVVSDWRLDNLEHEPLLQVLDEAYYSVSCGYWLAAYLQYPAFKHTPAGDFLQPYFELWQCGYGFALQPDKLRIGLLY